MGITTGIRRLPYLYTMGCPYTHIIPLLNKQHPFVRYCIKQITPAFNVPQVSSIFVQLLKLPLSSAILHSIHFKGNLRLEVSSLVLVDNRALSQLVYDGIHLGQLFNSHGFIGQCTKISERITHGLCVVAVLYPLCFITAYSLLCRLVMCHFLLFVVSFLVLRAGFEPAILRMKISRPGPTRRSEHHYSL